VTDIRSCEQCGTSFVPRREHARFCTPGCRAVWNRDHVGDPAVEVSALAWAITAMSDTTQRLARVRAVDRPRAFTVISEAVWWITIVDATLVRHYAETYDAVMAGQTSTEHQLLEGTLAGLRFVRNQIGDEADLGEFIRCGQASQAAGKGHITGWEWQPVPEPVLRSLSPRGQAWEMTRYQAYQAHLAGHTIGETFHKAAEFLKLAAAKAPITEAAMPAAR
jgi:hypothetical protein